MPISAFLTFVFISSFTPGPNNFMAISFANAMDFEIRFPFVLALDQVFF